MDANFWHQRWQLGQIGFHEGVANTLLEAHFAALDLAQGARVFVPLCGKTRDIAWLLAQGFLVVGAELSPIAIDQLFLDLGVKPQIAQAGPMLCYQAQGLTIFVGDIFALTAQALGRVDAIYDRAALVALPAPMRDRYARHIVALTQTAPQLLICFSYDQSLFSGPPFSIDAAELARLYGAGYGMELLADLPAKGGIRGIPAQEAIWKLTKHKD